MLCYKFSKLTFPGIVDRHLWFYTWSSRKEDTEISGQCHPIIAKLLSDFHSLSLLSFFPILLYSGIQVIR